MSADNISIYKIGILKSAKNDKFNHASLWDRNIMYDLRKNVKDNKENVM